MASGQLNSVIPSVHLSLQQISPAKTLQNAQIAPLHLLHLPTEILDFVLHQITDFDSLFACRRTCRRMYEIYERSHAQFNTRATLDALAKRDLQLREPCLFAAVAMKDNRQPSMYLKPAIRALHRGQSSLNQNYCRALLGLRHFVGYDENAPEQPGFRFQAVTDEGDVGGHSVRREIHDYHFVRMGKMSDQDVTFARQGLWLEGL